MVANDSERLAIQPLVTPTETRVKGNEGLRATAVTIAACYVTPEGVVLGADSTASTMLAGGFHYFNYNQKIFEVGEPGTGTLGMATWGLGGIGTQSHRTIVAMFDDDLKSTPPKDMKEVADRWTDKIWAQYQPNLARCLALNQKPPFDKAANPPNPAARTEAEEMEFEQLKHGLGLGFFIGGHLLPARAPAAFGIAFDPLAGRPTPVQFGSWNFAGAPNMIGRLINGFDGAIRDDLLKSGKWSGTAAELDQLLSQHQLATPYLPIREAIDFVHACVASTIKAMKFSNLAQICGGPIEIAVITTDRRFRWVRHKEWDAAIAEGAPS